MTMMMMEDLLDKVVDLMIAHWDKVFVTIVHQ
jgi:hypothetical protein